MARCAKSPAQTRHDRRVMVTMSIYVVALFAAVKQTPGTALAYAIAAVPALAVAATFLIIGRYLIEETDEYLRARSVKQIVWATGAAMIFASLWGFLEIAGLPHLPLYWVTIAWFLANAVAALALWAADR